MNVRAKFQVQRVTTHKGGTVEVFLDAAHDAGNESWSKWTPSGTICMQITNPPAAEAFKPGDFLYVDFTSAPAKGG